MATIPPSRSTSTDWVDLGVRDGSTLAEKQENLFHNRIGAIPHLPQSDKSLYGRVTAYLLSYTEAYVEIDRIMKGTDEKGKENLLVRLLEEGDAQKFRHALSLAPPSPTLHEGWILSEKCTPAHILLLEEIYPKPEDREKLFTTNNYNLLFRMNEKLQSFSFCKVNTTFGTEHFLALYEVCPEAARMGLFAAVDRDDRSIFHLHVAGNLNVKPDLVLFLIGACPEELRSKVFGPNLHGHDGFTYWSSEDPQTLPSVVKELAATFSDPEANILPYAVRELLRFGWKDEALRIISEQLSLPSRDQFFSKLIEIAWQPKSNENTYIYHNRANEAGQEALVSIFPDILAMWKEKGGTDEALLAKAQERLSK